MGKKWSAFRRGATPGAMQSRHPNDCQDCHVMPIFSALRAILHYAEAILHEAGACEGLRSRLQQLCSYCHS
jgi:hypothetical protein